MLNDNAVSIAEKELARTAYELDQIMRYVFMNRIIILKMVGDGKHCFNRSFAKMVQSRRWISSDDLCNGFWEACKHMLFGDQPDGRPWTNDHAKTMAFAELDAYDRASPTKHSYGDWHDALGSLS